MTKLINGSAPPSSSTKSNRAAVHIPPPSNVKVHPPSSDPPPPPHTNPQQELEWRTLLENFERLMNEYQNRAREGGATEQDAERLAEAMDNVAGGHTDPKVKNYWEQYAQKFREADPEEREGILEGIGKGLLILLTSPFYVVGAALLTAGLILGGVGFTLRGAGRLMRKLTFWGSSPQRSSASVDTISNTR